jgi:hypothetical protein
VGLNYFKTKDMDVFYNADDIFMSFNTKCNLIDTIEGTIFLNFLANHLVSIDQRLIPVSLLLRALDFSSIIMDLTDLSRWFNSFVKHRDPYNVGAYSGKFAKILTQAYMSGLVDIIVNIILAITGQIDTPPISNPPAPSPLKPANGTVTPIANETTMPTNQTITFLYV